MAGRTACQGSHQHGSRMGSGTATGPHKLSTHSSSMRSRPGIGKHICRIAGPAPVQEGHHLCVTCTMVSLHV